ncbi:Transcription termination factor 3, mitochondrial [Sergentomyia squamirostris]
MMKIKFFSSSWSVTQSSVKLIRSLCSQISLPQVPENDSPLRIPENPNDVERAPNFSPTFNFASYINKSETLQQLLKLGVDLYKIERRKGLENFLLKLDFEHDMKHVIKFLHDQGISPDRLGQFLTKNPLIFKENCDDLQVRINYLESKKFQRDEIIRIIDNNPFWLMFSTQRIDKRLGFFQKSFYLTGREVRQLVCTAPRLITYSMEHIRMSTFSVKEEMGYETLEAKKLLLKIPKLWMINHDSLMERFDYVHKDMEISHEQLLKDPYILLSRTFRIRQRHDFLKYLGKAQYDPKKDLYISLKNLVVGSDEEFAINIARSSIPVYQNFLKTL